MENCLVAKLKSVVNNDTLPKLGVFRFTLTVGATPSRNNVFHAVVNNKSLFSIISGPSGGTIKAVRVSPSEDEDKGTSFYLDNSLDAYTFSVSGTYVIEISEKYNLKTFRTGDSLTCNTEEFIALSGLEGVLTLKGSGVTGELKNLIKASFTQYDLSSLRVTGELNDFAGVSPTVMILTSLESMTGDLSFFANNQSLTILALNGSNKVTGSISQINTMSNLTNFQCAGDPLITGSLADLLDNGALINTSLRTLVVTNTNNITKDAADVTTLRSLGVDVVL